ncbi:MAG: prepilin-type N-terminal cleavage/methylation domain-containing protein [Candidatus Nealsonbacteria bacterium]|nr:prepilin-type N-terminal cleavage/methylation domain-containing protein [Candidatus Nealsonbacteria bacterium]
MKRGFTLMEILIYVSVLAIIFLAVYSFLDWAVKLSAKAGAIREVTDNARRAMEIMTHEIRSAKSVYEPTSGASQLSLETGNYLPNGETSSYIDFYLCGQASSTICFKKESQNPIAITSDKVNVTGFKFIQLSTTTPSIQISLSLDYKQASINSTSSASLRPY